MEKYTPEQMAKWIMDDFAVSKGDPDTHLHLIDLHKETRNGFNYLYLDERLDLFSAMINAITTAFIRKHEGQIVTEEVPMREILRQRREDESAEDYFAHASFVLEQEIQIILTDYRFAHNDLKHTDV